MWLHVYHLFIVIMKLKVTGLSGIQFGTRAIINKARGTTVRVWFGLFTVWYVRGTTVSKTLMN